MVPLKLTALCPTRRVSGNVARALHIDDATLVAGAAQMIEFACAAAALV